MHLLVTLGTEGPTNWVRLPDGQKFNLGPISVLSFVTKLALGGNRSARSILDGFLAGKEVLLRVDEDRMWELLAPRRTRWASDSFIGSQVTTQHKSPTGTITMTIDKDLGILEAHVEKLHKAASARVSTQKMAEGVNLLVRLAKSVGNQSDNSAYYGMKPDLFEVGDPEPEIFEVGDPEPKVETTKLAYDIHKANSLLATQVLDQMESVNSRIDELVTAGKRFNATKAKADAYLVTSKIAGIVNEVDLTVPWVADDLKKLAAQAEHLHGLFFPKK